MFFVYNKYWKKILSTVETSFGYVLWCVIKIAKGEINGRIQEENKQRAYLRTT